ncbi:glycoside hydrolase family protein [Listeria grandensis FSL F6-0971]|uniref:Glycoside hydrolase family protein n=1 Tax=Listeria grandensis FSL F6-0971 TaxID=1265819 RepID=W7AYA5_9LIST|nr:glycoside hydrolase family protein [Listeria grandensis FSL F6-0971]
MSKKVAMFVWNTYTNDARVKRACVVLSENGYDVDLFALWDKTLLRTEKLNPNFQLYRLGFRSTMLRKRLASIIRHWYTMCFLSILFLFGMLYFPNMTLLATIMLCIVAKSARYNRRITLFFSMIYHAQKSKYAIYHANDLNTLLQAVICGKWLGKARLIYDSHEVQTSRTGYNSPVYGIAERWLLRFVDICIHENHTRAKYIQNLYDFYPEVIHNYPSTLKKGGQSIDLHDRLGLNKETPILLYQGGIQVGRGLDKIIEAAPLIERGVIVFIGDGKLKEALVTQVRERQLESRVRFIPKVPLDELAMYTNQAYLGFQVLNNVCFNHYSASSNKLFEYIMSDVPIIASGFPEIKKVVEEHRVGVVVDGHEPVSIATGVNKLVHDVELHKTSQEKLFSS